MGGSGTLLTLLGVDQRCVRREVNRSFSLAHIPSVDSPCSSDRLFPISDFVFCCGSSTWAPLSFRGIGLVLAAISGKENVTRHIFTSSSRCGGSK